MIKKNIMGMLFHILTFVLTLMLIIGIDIYNFEFDWSKITWKYLYMRVLISIGYTVIKISISNFTYDLSEVSDKSYVEITSILFNYSKSYRGNKFNGAINKYDYSLKKEEWIKKMETKEFKHQRSITANISKELKELEPNQYSKKTIKWLKKLEDINLMLTEKWIDDNLLIQKINYPEITPLEVLYGTIEYKTEKSLLDRKPLKRILLKTLPTALLSLTATVALGALSDIKSSGGVGLFVNIISILTVLTINVSIGVANAIRAHKSRFINANKRSEIFLDYKEGVYDKLPEIPHRIKQLPVKSNQEEFIEEIKVEHQDEIKMAEIEEIKIADENEGIFSDTVEI